MCNKSLTYNLSLMNYKSYACQCCLTHEPWFESWGCDSKKNHDANLTHILTWVCVVCVCCLLFLFEWYRSHSSGLMGAADIMEEGRWRREGSRTQGWRLRWRERLKVFVLLLLLKDLSLTHCLTQTMGITILTCTGIGEASTTVLRSVQVWGCYRLS